jgi:transposase
MLTLSAGIRVFICTRVADMRKGFDGLSAMASEVMRQDPLSGHLFVFRNHRGDRMKVLYWGGDGLCLWYKRLEAGTFEWKKGEGGAVEISNAELMMLIEGISLARVERRKRFCLPSVKQPNLLHKPSPVLFFLARRSFFRNSLKLFSSVRVQCNDDFLRPYHSGFRTSSR